MTMKEPRNILKKMHSGIWRLQTDGEIIKLVPNIQKP